MFFFFKQKTAYEMRISDWSSDGCSSDLHLHRRTAPIGLVRQDQPGVRGVPAGEIGGRCGRCPCLRMGDRAARGGNHRLHDRPLGAPAIRTARQGRSEEHTSGLQSLMRISYAVFRLKKKKNTTEIARL